MRHLFTIKIFLLALILTSCNYKKNTSEKSLQKASMVPNQENHQEIELHLNTVIHNIANNTLTYTGVIDNKSDKKYLIPISWNIPQISFFGLSVKDLHEADSIQVSALYLRFYDAHNQEITLNPILSTPGFVVPNEDSINHNSNRSPKFHKDSVTYVLENAEDFNHLNIIEEEDFKRHHVNPYKKSYNWYYRYKLLQKDMIVLEPNTSQHFTIALKVSDVSPPFYTFWEFPFKATLEKTKYVDMVALSNKREIMNEIFLTSDLRKFEQEKIEIYNGTIKSNKLAIKIE